MERSFVYLELLLVAIEQNITVSCFCIWCFL